jgi:hypothetical protein
MICYDDTAGVYEVYSDTNATEWLGAYNTRREAQARLVEWRRRT